VSIAEPLLAGKLAQRDQWLRHVADRCSERLSRATLEAALCGAITDALASLCALAPRHIEAELVALARYAAVNVAATGKHSPILALSGLAALPGDAVDDLPLWRGLAALLLTKEGSARDSVNVLIGFPTATGKVEKAMRTRWKARMGELLAAIVEHAEFLIELDHTRKLPPPRYSEQQWEVVEALVAALPLAVAQLDVLFRDRGQVDFTAVSQAAVRALGEPDDPTDLALALDYRIRHLLVDEFQDTSQSQYELLARLTAGWEQDDGRTLFVVGDPMQSIYRFREADVALYLRARLEGIGPVVLEPLTLRVNFRSQAGIVDWVNKAFRQVMPEAEDLASGAVPFAASEAVKPALPGLAVTLDPVAGNDRRVEAELVLDRIRAAREDDPCQRVAILVRTRSQLARIVPALKAAQIGFQAIEIDLLGERPVVQDLHALTRALLHPADRVAWLTVLRAPWCGLALADLDALAGFGATRCVGDVLRQPDLLARLSKDGCARTNRVYECLNPFLARRASGSLRRRVEGAWLALGGPATAPDAAGLADAAVFLDTLDELEQGGDLSDFSALAQRVDALYAKPDASVDDSLQIMTIHKAKGLEFDVVIVPGLGYASRRQDRRLLLWLERPRTHGRTDLLLAPIRERSPDQDPVYEYLERLDAAKARHEDGRLLYVAATRARSRLHLIAHVDVRQGVPKPAARSLIERLWPVVEAEYARVARAVETSPDSGPDSWPDARPAGSGAIRRLAFDWTAPPPPRGIAVSPGQDRSRGVPVEVEFSWASETAKHIGTVVHRALQSMAEDGLERWNPARRVSMRAMFARDLRGLGVPGSELDRALARVAAAVDGALADDRARWLLADHADARSEWRLTGMLEGGIVDVAIDRSFVDGEGVRWIVDYKTGMHEGADPERFLDNERERYRVQLERYAALMRQFEARPIRLALYFPLMSGWREWAAPV